MAAPLSTAEHLSDPPAWALARVPGLERGAPPRALSRLSGGSVNHVFRVDSDCGRYVLRLNGAAWRRPGVDRGRELALHRAAAAAGIAPAIVYAEPDAQGLLISQYQQGRLWSEQDYQDLSALRRLGERLALLHRLPVPEIAAFDPWSIAQDYVRQIKAPLAAPERLATPLAELERSCAALREGAAPACISHGDLAHGNLLEGSRLWLLDWEYAQRSDALMDLACVIAYYPAVERYQAELAAAAGIGTAAGLGKALEAELAVRVHIYRALSWLWHLARGEPATAP
jgi:thiamine kinase